jgi:VWFA-related protein
MTPWFRLLTFLLLPFLALSAQNTQAPQLQPRTGEPQKVAPQANGPDRQIRIDVQVTDKSGAPALGLRKEDFTVLDDKRPQNILSFQAVDRNAPTNADPPVELLLVIDAVNSSFQTVSYERSELKKFLLQNGGKLAQPTALIFFTDSGTQMQNGFSRDGSALAEMYDKFETGLRTVNRSQGFYGAAERFELSLKALNSLVAYEVPHPGRKLLVWFSAGWPLLTGPSIDYTRKDEERFFDMIVAASSEMRRADITLYSIDPLGLADAGGVRIGYYEEFLKGIKSPNKAVPADLSLQVLAVQSGGRVLNGSNDLAQEVAEAGADARAFYILSFEGARADAANEYHAINVTVDKPGVKVRTRTGYYAQP